MTDQDKPRHREWTVSYKKGFGPWINRWPSDFEANEEERVRLVEYSALLEEREKVKALGAQVAELKIISSRNADNWIKHLNISTKQSEAIKVLRDAVQQGMYRHAMMCDKTCVPVCPIYIKREALSKVEALLGKGK